MTRKPTPPARKPWLKKDVAEIKRGIREGLTGAEIAKKLGRTPGAVYQRAYSEGIPMRGKAKKRR